MLEQRRASRHDPDMERAGLQARNCQGGIERSSRSPKNAEPADPTRGDAVGSACCIPARSAMHHRPRLPDRAVRFEMATPKRGHTVDER